MTTTPILAGTHNNNKSPAGGGKNKTVSLNEPSPGSNSTSSCSNTAALPDTPGGNCNTTGSSGVARVPVLSASDAANSNSFIRGVSLNRLYRHLSKTEFSL